MNKDVCLEKGEQRGSQAQRLTVSGAPEDTVLTPLEPREEEI